MPTAYIRTFGCQMNEYDSEVMAGLLREEGFELSGAIDDADLILVNTCYVRKKVEHKVYSFLGKIARLKKSRSSLMLGAGGCLAQRDPSKIVGRAPYVDLVWGTFNFHRVPDLIRRVRAGESPVVEVQPSGSLPDGLPVVRGKGYACYVPVIRGCDNFCTYCIVPYVRGREESRSPGAIMREVEQALEQGCREVVLLGQNVNSFVRDLATPVDFPELLRRVNGISGLRRVRFVTSHPKDLSRELMLSFARLEKVCEQLHLPVQSGSDRILGAMRRGYTSAHYVQLVKDLRSITPGLGLTTDIIVGFPGETEDDFRATLSLVEAIRFDGAFTFAYSALPGTPAARMTGQVPAEVKTRRLRTLIDLQKRITEENNAQRVGKTFEVLIEGPSAKNRSEYAGRTRTGQIVVFPAQGFSIGEFTRVRVTKGGCWALRGETV